MKATRFHAGQGTDRRELTAMRYYIGFDCGGTKTAAQILDESGAPLGRGVGGPGNVVLNEDITLRDSIRHACANACLIAGLPPDTSFAGACAGIAGYSAEARRDAFASLLREEVAADGYRVEPDYTIAHWGAFCGKPGIIVVAGTGAVTYGRNAEGTTYREDGLGFLLGDRGSGFNLGLYTLRYALEQLRNGVHNALTEATLTHIQAEHQNDIIHWLYGNFSTHRVAELAPIVGALAEQGDIPARELVAEMAYRLRYAVRETRYKLTLPKDCPVCTLGGLWNIGAFFRSEFEEPRWHPAETATATGTLVSAERFCIVESIGDAAFGAAWLVQMNPTSPPRSRQKPSP